MTLGWSKGFAALSAGSVGYTLRRAALTTAAIGAFVAGLAATSAAQQGVVDPGVYADGVGSKVQWVAPTGYAWQVGIRVGQLVVAETDSGEPAGWTLATVDGGRHYLAELAPIERGLRDSLPVGLAAVVAGGLALLFLRTRRSWALPAASLAFIAAATPLDVRGDLQLSTATMAAAFLVPSTALAMRLPGGLAPRLIVGLGALAFGGWWAGLRLAGAPPDPILDGLRSGVAIWGTAALLGVRVVLPIFRGAPIRMTRPSVFDAAFLAGLAGLAVVLVVFLNVPAVLVGAALLLAMAVMPKVRERVGRPLGEALLADVREHAAAEAAEDERARIAREIHDVPLQELVSIIRRLEVLPGTQAESDDLRTLAGHLRTFAADMRPPVLDDFGLPAALEYLAEQTASPEVPVVAFVADGVGMDARNRPPPEVELAMFRIAREAVSNALRHSGANHVRIQAKVAPARVEMVVEDNGTGLRPDAARAAGKRNRLGLSSMRRRAQAIDAEFSIGGSGLGTTVRVLWQQ